MSDLIDNAKRIPAPNHSAYLPKRLPSVLPKINAKETSKKVTPAMIETASIIEQEIPINVTPTASASMLVATACKAMVEKAKEFIGQVFSSSFLNISIMSFTAKNKKIAAVTNFAIGAIIFAKSEPIK